MERSPSAFFTLSLPFGAFAQRYAAQFAQPLAEVDRRRPPIRRTILAGALDPGPSLNARAVRGLCQGDASGS
jgi:hypothetical protein